MHVIKNEIQNREWKDFKNELVTILGRALTLAAVDDESNLIPCLHELNLISAAYLYSKGENSTEENVVTENNVYFGEELTDVLNNEFYATLDKEKIIEIREVPTYKFMVYDAEEYSVPDDVIIGTAKINIPSNDQYEYYLKVIISKDNVLYAEKDIFAKEYPYIKAAYIREIKEEGDYDVIEINEMFDNLVNTELLHTDTKMVTWEDNGYKVSNKPKSEETKRLEGNRQSLLDNRNIRFMYDIDGNVYHDKSCQEVKNIALEKLRGSDNPPKDKKPCNDCLMDMLIRKGCKDDFKNVGMYKYFFRKGDVDIDLLKSFLNDRNASFRVMSVNKMKLTYNEDTWMIETDGRGNLIKLWHNNYKVDKRGKRHIDTAEFHEQISETATTVVMAMHYIMDYKYNERH